MMDKHLRELADRAGQEYKLHEVIAAAARDVDRLFFILSRGLLAGYLPIYALTGPPGKLFVPMGKRCHTRCWVR